MSRSVGALFERRAAAFLRHKGFTILQTNFTCPGGEIDLICDDHGTLVFVEVRARRGQRYGTPEETVGRTKQRRLILAARHYLMRREEECPCRFDVVAIEGEVVTHLPDAFTAEE